MSARESARFCVGVLGRISILVEKGRLCCVAEREQVRRRRLREE